MTAQVVRRVADEVRRLSQDDFGQIYTMRRLLRLRSSGTSRTPRTGS
jgi:hypothetical protein